MSYDEQETRFETDPKTKHNNKYSQSKFRMNHNPCHTTAVPYAEALGYIPKPRYSTDSNSSFASPDPPKSQEEKGPLTINR